MRFIYISSEGNCFISCDLWIFNARWLQTGRQISYVELSLHCWYLLVWDRYGVLHTSIFDVTSLLKHCINSWKFLIDNLTRCDSSSDKISSSSISMERNNEGDYFFHCKLYFWGNWISFYYRRLNTFVAGKTSVFCRSFFLLLFLNIPYIVLSGDEENTGSESRSFVCTML